MNKTSNFYKDVLKLVTGTGIAQVIPLLISPVVSRIYTPDDFGAFSVFNSIVSILFLFVTARYERAIVLPKSDDDAIALFQATLIINFAFVCLLVVSLFFWGNWILAQLNAEVLTSWLFLIPLYCLTYGIYQSLNYLLNRNKRFGSLAMGSITHSSITAVSQIAGERLREGGLLLAVVIGRLSSVVYLTVQSFRTGLLNFEKLITLNPEGWKVLRTYKEFPLFALPNGIVNTFSSTMPIFLLGTYFSLEVVGQYGWSARLIQAPIALVAAATYQVFYQKASEYFNAGANLEVEARKLYRHLFMIGVVPAIIGLFFAPEIFSVVFGEEWRISGVYTQYLLPWFFMVYLNTPLSAIVYVYGKQRLMLIFEVILLGLRFSALYVGYKFNSVDLAIVLFSAVGFFYHVFLTRLLLYFVSNETTTKEQ